MSRTASEEGKKPEDKIEERVGEDVGESEEEEDKGENARSTDLVFETEHTARDAPREYAAERSEPVERWKGDEIEEAEEEVHKSDGCGEREHVARHCCVESERSSEAHDKSKDSCEQNVSCAPGDGDERFAPARVL